jgi:siroheme synthase (precorrin-2 oxidase/ferrochelatase)
MATRVDVNVRRVSNGYIVWRPNTVHSTDLHDTNPMNVLVARNDQEVSEAIRHLAGELTQPLVKCDA